MKHHDVVIIGGGPAGSVLASFLANRGMDVAIVEKEGFPRFHIGESLLPFSMDIFRDIGFFDELNGGKYLRKFGAQFHHFSDSSEDEGIRFDFASGLDSDHPMAFEVPRADFDHDLLLHAQKRGATLYAPETVLEAAVEEGGVRMVTDARTVRATYVADATGQGAFFSRRKKRRFENFDLNNVAVFTHFSDVARPQGVLAGDILIGVLPEGRWCWLIPFQDGGTSVGVVCPSKGLRNIEDREKYLLDSVAHCQPLRSRMKHARRIGEMGMVSNYSHYCDELVEDRIILVGDAASFLDPIFSSGVHMAVSMAKKAADVIESAFREKAPLSAANRKQDYETFVQTGTRRFHRFIRMFYDGNFVADMKKTHGLKHVRMAFTSWVAGDVWNEENPLFRTGVLT